MLSVVMLYNDYEKIRLTDRITWLLQTTSTVEKDEIEIVPKQTTSGNMYNSKKPVGLTRDTGWQFGIRKTFSRSQLYLWNFMFSDKGLEIWLGKLVEKLEARKTYYTKEGIEGKVNVLVPYSHIRMTWKLKSWENSSILQVRVMGNNDRGVISFHLEKLRHSHQREEMKLYWNKKMSELESAVMNK